MISFTQTQSIVTGIDKKTDAMTLQLRGMVRVIRDNREAMSLHPESVQALAVASMQLAQMAKRLMEESDA